MICRARKPEQEKDEKIREKLHISSIMHSELKEQNHVLLVIDDLYTESANSELLKNILIRERY